MKRKLILLQIFIVVILVCTTSLAAVNSTIDVKVSNTTLNKGDTVEVTLSVKDVDNKITNVEGYINYNKSVFETLTYDSIVKNSDNTVKIGDEVLPVEDLTNASKDNMPSTSAYVGFNASPITSNDTKIVIDFNNGISKDEDLLKINFKVKSNVTAAEVKDAISFSQFVITSGERSEEITKNISITIKEVSNPGDDSDKDNDNDGNKDNDKDDNKDNNDKENDNKDNNNNNNNNNNGNQNNGDQSKNKADNKNNTNNTGNTNNNKSGNTNQVNNTTDDTVAGTKLPATGAKILVIPAIILVAIAYISYNKYTKMKGI